MIAPVVFDPASFSLWFDAEILNQSPDGPTITHALYLTLLNDFEGAFKIAGEIEEEKAFRRCLHLMSSVWHEKRHFYDMLLTNYGAFHFRQYLEVYINFGAIAREVVEGKGELWLPLDIYADEVRREIHDLDFDPEEKPFIAALADSILRRKRNLHEDRLLYTTSLGRFQIGGEAQLESLAYMYQFGALQVFCGPEVSMAVQRDLPEEKLANLKYRGIQNFCAARGIMHAELTPDVLILSKDFMYPVLTAALCCRKYEIETDDDWMVRSPSARFATFAGILQEQFEDHKTFTLMDYWEFVNQESRKLWGRTIIEELERDLEMEEDYAGKAREPADAAVLNAFGELHELRTRMVRDLKEQPEIHLDMENHIREVLPRLFPRPVFAAKSGSMHPVPEEYTLLYGYKDPEQRPEGNWWWATTLRDWNGDNDQDIRLKSDAWNELISHRGPQAKLILNGRNHRMMLGPELLSSEAALEMAGITVRFDPMFRYPAENNETDLYFYLAQKEHYNCDLCGNRLEAEEEIKLISPWVFRYNQDIAATIMNALGEGEIGHLRYVRDWSPWISCGECRRTLGDIMRPDGTGA